MKAILMMLMVSVSAVVSQLLIKKGVLDLGISRIDLPSLLAALRSPYIIAAGLIQLFSYIVWLFVLAKANLGYAMGITGAMVYILLPLLGWWFFGEKMTPLQWIGLVLISCGLFCLVAKNI